MQQLLMAFRFTNTDDSIHPLIHHLMNEYVNPSISCLCSLFFSFTSLLFMVWKIVLVENSKSSIHVKCIFYMK